MSRLDCLAVCACLPILANTVAAQADYEELDYIQGSQVNLANFSVRGVLRRPGTTPSEIWGVNQHAGFVRRFFSTTSWVEFAVPWDPVALAYYPGNGGEVLVACRGSWCVVVLDANDTTGTGIKKVIQLRPGDPLTPDSPPAKTGLMAEPSDILVLDDNAFVSCMAADTVTQIDLLTGTVVRVFHHTVDPEFVIKSPLFLAEHPTNATVLVAPLHSGNRSTSEDSLTASTMIVDAQSLEDEDLFEITPFVDANSPGAVSVVASGQGPDTSTGTILFAHGTNQPANTHWQLNIESLNKVFQNEPAANGVFVENRLSILPNSFASVSSIDLDNVAPGVRVGQPFGLDFDEQGRGYITGTLTDNVVVLDSSGSFLDEIPLPAGSIPRAIVVRDISGSSLKIVWVECWGTNEIRRYRWSPTTNNETAIGSYPLGYDPTPVEVSAGREIFYDGDRSANGNISCASCHIEGGSDLLAWNLSNAPLEEKGPMMTQTLVGIERVGPFHWRGERQLSDFNGAFKGLLGDLCELDDMTANPDTGLTDLGEFEAFVFSLRNPANPHQNRERVLDDTVHSSSTTASASATSGQILFDDPGSFPSFGLSCNDCHPMPTGTSGVMNTEQFGTDLPRRTTLKPSPFHELWRKQAPTVTVGEVGATRSFLGGGFAHNGINAELFDFIDPIAGGNFGPDITDFVFQADAGLAPAVHFSFLLDGATNLADFDAQVTGYLHAERDKTNCDVAVIGKVETSPGTTEARRWFWDRAVASYVGEDGSLRTAQDFRNGAANESNVFLGLPVGMAERFAVDFDMDDCLNGLDSDDQDPSVNCGSAVPFPGFATSGVPTPPIMDIPGNPGMVWITQTTARIVFTTDQPTTAVVDYSTSGHAATAESRSLSRTHSIVLTNLRPSTPAATVPGCHATPAQETVQYTTTITLTNAHNTGAAYAGPTFTTDEFFSFMGTQSNRHCHEANIHLVSELHMNPLFDTGSLLTATITPTVSMKRGQWVVPSGGSVEERPRAEDRIVVGRVFVRRGGCDGVVQSANSQGLAVTPRAQAAVVRRVFANDTTVELGGAGFTAEAGPYVVATTATGPDGKTIFAINIAKQSTMQGKDLNPADTLIFNIEAVVENNGPLDLTSSPGNVIIPCPQNTAPFDQWSFPDTTEEHASVESSNFGPCATCP